MTGSDLEVETWKPIPGFTTYEASDRGLIRNSGHKIMATRVSRNGYALVNLTSDEGKRETKSVHRCILAAHAGPCPPGMETLHGPGGPLDNRWPENIRYGTHEANVAERTAARPPRAPEPPKPCMNYERCGGHIGKGGRRCHACVVQLGRDGCELVWDGMTLQDAADQLDYAAVHLHTLMVRYGGYGVRPPEPQSRSVFATVRARFRRGDAP